MEDLNARLQLEVKKSGVFERKSAELECINDELRLENRVRWHVASDYTTRFWLASLLMATAHNYIMTCILFLKLTSD